MLEIKNARELLELAAKASGINGRWYTEGAGEVAYQIANEGLFLNGAYGPDNSRYWNPLINDGDAFRLALTMKMQVLVRMHSTYVLGEGMEAVVELHGRDERAATRLAITKVAAMTCGGSS